MIAQPGFACLLAYNPGLVGATDIPDAWHSRFPATLEVTSNWPALAQLGAPTSARDRGDGARPPTDRRRGRPDVDTPVPRHRSAHPHDRPCRRARRARAVRLEPLSEQVQAGRVQDAEAAAVCRMLDQAGYAHLKVSATRRLPSLHGYPRAVTS